MTNSGGLDKHTLSPPSHRRSGWGLAPAAVLVAYAAVLLATSPGDTWRVEWDSALYVLTGRALAAGEGYTVHGEPFFLRPPGLSWLISWFVVDGEVSFTALSLALRALAAAGVAAIYACLRPRFGRSLALATALLTGTSALFVDLLPWVLSDIAFLAFLFGAFAFLERGLDAERGVRWLVVGALLLAGAAYLRTTALLVLPGLVLLPALRGRGRGRLTGLAPAALALLACLPWMLHARSAAAEAPRPAEQLLLFDYPTALLRVDVGDPESDFVSLADLSERARVHGSALARELTWTAWHGAPHWLQVVWLALALAGVVLAVRAGPGVRESFFLANALLLVLYFAFARRLALPLVPAIYLYPLLAIGAGARALVARSSKRGALGEVAVLGVGAALLAVNLSALPRVPGHGDLVARDSGSAEPDYLIDLAAWVRTNTPEDAVLLCSQAPALEVLSGRTCYTFRFLRESGALRRYEPDYLVLDSPARPGLERTARQRAIEETPVKVRGRMFPVTVLRLDARTPRGTAD